MLAVCLLWACQVTTAGAEGFALTEWSSRGLSLAGGMVGRADDPSAIAYNAAGITQLPGTHVMGGFAAIAPMGTIDLDLADGSHTSTTTKPHIWAAPHAYVTHQLNDRFWLGLGLFSRFGLGNEFADNWTGRYNLTNINFQTFSLVPTVALKVNDVLSLSAGVEIMHASFAMGQQIPSMQYIGYFPSKGEDSKMTLNGTGWGARASAWARASSGATGRSIWPMPIFGCTAWTIRRPMPPVSVRPWGMSAAGTAGTRWPISIPPPSAIRSDGWTATSGMTGCRQAQAQPECRHGPVAVLTERNWYFSFEGYNGGKRDGVACTGQSPAARPHWHQKEREALSLPFFVL